MPRRAVSPAVRRPALRLLALGWGALLLIGHVLVWHDPIRSASLPPDVLDAIKHSLAFAAFALLYRASWASSGPGSLNPNLATVIVCSSWGALCELSQLTTPLRGFAWHELALNIAVPGLVAGLAWLVGQLWES